MKVEPNQGGKCALSVSSPFFFEVQDYFPEVNTLLYTPISGYDIHFGNNGHYGNYVQNDNYDNFGLTRHTRHLCHNDHDSIILVTIEAYGLPLPIKQ